MNWFFILFKIFSTSIFQIVEGVQRTLNQPSNWKLTLKEKTNIAYLLTDADGGKYSMFKDEAGEWNWKCSIDNCNATVKVSYELISDHQVVHKKREKRNVSIPNTQQSAKNGSTKTGPASKKQKTNPSAVPNNGAKD